MAHKSEKRLRINENIFSFLKRKRKVSTREKRKERKRVDEIMGLTSKEGFQIWVWSVMLLLLKMFMVSFYTGMKRRASHTPAHPEDNALLLRGHAEPTADPHDVERGLGLHRNDMENIYVFIFISLIYPTAVSLTADTQNPTYLNDA